MNGEGTEFILIVGGAGLLVGAIGVVLEVWGSRLKDRLYLSAAHLRERLPSKKENTE